MPAQGPDQSASHAGVVNLYKPTGVSSARYVYRLRPIFGLRKVGHAGTLDPFADGVLLACVGRGTKLVERLMALPKLYRPTTPVEGARPCTLDDILAVAKRLMGEVDQVPPAFSAVKVGGVPSYRRAHRGEIAEPPPKRVRIDAIEVLGFAWPELALEIRCGRGTYIRAIARDLGAALGCGAVCATLTRAAVEPFTLDQAVDLNRATPDQVRAALIPLQQAAARLGPDAEQSHSR